MKAARAQTTEGRSELPGRPSSPNAPKVLEKALRVLDLFVPARPVWGASEIARELSIPVPTAHRIIRSLESHGYLARSDTRWQLGVAAVDLGRRASASIDLRWTLRPALHQLLSESGETVLLAVYDEGRRGVLCIDRFEAAHSLRLSIDIGRLTPLHAGAASKALLAFLPEPLIEETLRSPLERFAPGTICDPDELRAEITRIQSSGWAFSREENNVGAWGMSAPVFAPGKQPMASIGIAAPIARYSPGSRRGLAAVVTSAARMAETLLDARAAHKQP